MAVGLLRPDAGTVRVFDQSPYDNTALLSEIGFVAQDTPLYRDFTAVDLITMGAKLNRRWDSGLARNRLGQLGIPPNKPVGKLSGGQRASGRARPGHGQTATAAAARRTGRQH